MSELECQLYLQQMCTRRHGVASGDLYGTKTCIKKNVGGYFLKALNEKYSQQHQLFNHSLPTYRAASRAASLNTIPPNLRSLCCLLAFSSELRAETSIVGAAPRKTAITAMMMQRPFMHLCFESNILAHSLRAPAQSSVEKFGVISNRSPLRHYQAS